MSDEEKGNAVSVVADDTDWQVREDARQIQFRKQFALTQAADLVKELIRAGRVGGASTLIAESIVEAARVFDALLSE